MLNQVLTTAREDAHFFWVYYWNLLRQNGQLANRKVLVNGSPKTGTTWMYTMIASLPGFQPVGNYDGRIDRYKTAARGDVVHGHDFFSDNLHQLLRSNHFRTVLMIRDPRDQLVSRMFHLQRKNVHGGSERYREMPLEDLMILCIEGNDDLPGMDTLTDLTLSWFDAPQTHLVRYETLLRQTEQQMVEVLRHVGFAEKQLRPLAYITARRNRFERLSKGRRIWKNGRKPGQENRTSHFRKGISGDWKNHFKPIHVERFKAVAGQQLIDLGYETDFDWGL